MKKLLYLIISACAVFAACDFETSDNGELDGYWQLRQVDTLAGGIADMRNSGLFWSVQVNLLEVRDNYNPFNSLLFRFDKAGDILRIWNPIVNHKRISDSIVHDSATLARYYIVGTYNADSVLESVLHIQELGGEHMVLTNKLYRLHFRKY
ncbi:MAG: lipocalin-like domain-containing protein [Prevotella sp.]|nr:lipocalin-like domain-containing protein [Prevotella sp.]